MTMLQVLYVIEAAKQKNFSKAAERLYLSQPALSLQIRHLEEELGCELFRREPQGVSLTAAGQVFYKDALPVAEAWQKLQRSSRQLQRAACSLIRVGLGPRTFSNGLFAPIVSFFDGHPDTEVSFITDIAGNVLDALEEKRLHFAFDRLPPESMIHRRERFAVFELLQERQCILMPPGDPRSQAGQLPFQALDGAAFVSGPEGSVDDVVLRDSCRRYGVTASRIHRANELASIMALIRSGKGVALGPASFSAQYGLLAVPLLPETWIPLNLICLKEDQNNPVITQLRRFLKAVLSPSVKP